jgi:hypothetical protein
MRGDEDRSAGVEAMLCAALRGERVPWPDSASDEFAEDCLRDAKFHRVHALLYEASHAGTGLASWPLDVIERLGEWARAEAVSEMIRSQELTRALNALAGAGVRGVLMKGAALAHTTYASPCLRPRADADLLVHDRDREAAERVLARCGFLRAPRIAGKLIEYQAPYFRDAHGLRHVIDLHWRVFNRQALAGRFPFDELAASAICVPAIAESARVLDPVDALLVACLHAPAHHRGQRRPLVEAYDVHRLASDFAPDDWHALRKRAEAREVRCLCLSGLREAQRRFGTALPGDVVEALSLAELRSEPSARLLAAGRSDPFWDDVRAIPGWAGRLQFLYEAAFPSAEFVGQQYGVRSRALLPLLYVHRGVTGLFRRSVAR